MQMHINTFFLKKAREKSITFAKQLLIFYILIQLKYFTHLKKFHC